MSVQLCLLCWLHARWYVLGPLQDAPGESVLGARRVCVPPRVCGLPPHCDPRLGGYCRLERVSAGTPGSFSRVFFFGLWVAILVVLSGNRKMRLSFADGTVTTDHLEGQKVQHHGNHAQATRHGMWCAHADDCGACRACLGNGRQMCLPRRRRGGVLQPCALSVICTESDLAMTLLRPTCVTRGPTVRSRATRPHSRANACACMYYVCLWNGAAARLAKPPVATARISRGARVQVGRDAVVCARNSANHERAV